MRRHVMKKRLLTSVLAIIICITGILSFNSNVRAEAVSEDIDISYLMTDNALIGYSQNQTWGVYYSDGYSIINKISSTKIGAGGVTNAAIRCEVRVTAILERKTSSGSWERVTSWTQTNENALSAMISKSVTVGTGYYYRVRCNHYAGSDSSTSCTNALWM